MTINKWADLGVDHNIIQSLSERGINEPFPIQELTIPDALKLSDVCGKAKTGSGKTLAFGIPTIQNLAQSDIRTVPRGLILVPTRELATQVKEELDPLCLSKSLTVAAIYGGANIDEQIKNIQDGVDIVVATPGRMIDLLEREEIGLQSLEVVVLDEADRMADMGFLPQVEWILRRVQRKHQTLLFSATLDGVVNTLIQRYQDQPIMHEVETKEITVEEMTHRFLHVHERDKVKVAAAIARPVFSNSYILKYKGRMRPVSQKTPYRRNTCAGHPRRFKAKHQRKGSSTFCCRKTSCAGSYRCSSARYSC
ncbi:MAG: hypothetical protein Ct9H90mP30_5480 [Actinomycetota bacterium]|nr:MAG: hypothetical protein Ct9H90mP30_5480 [Actinomycetota bacterium]